MPWDPNQYNKFQTERAAPFDDLWRMIEPRPYLRVLDLGCGDGHLTRALADRLPSSDTLGLDSSPEMLARAAPLARPGLRFAQRTIEDACAEPSFLASWELLFSNAAIQWVDDHDALIPRLFDLISPGGQLALQLPSNHDHISHTLLRDIAAEPPFCDTFQGWSRRVPVLPLDRYAALLYACGGCDITVIEKVYPHVLADADAVLEWTLGTAALPYLSRLPAPLQPAFVTRYRALLRERLPQSPIFYGFRRTLLSARRA
jgi:trans-aconitate 2-methyltransferase